MILIFVLLISQFVKLGFCDDILLASSYFHDLFFPIWNEKIHSITVSLEQTSQFISSDYYSHEYMHEQLQPVSIQIKPEFLRPNQIYDKQFNELVLFKWNHSKENQTLKDNYWNSVSQGGIRDCSLISALIAMAMMETHRNQQLISDKIYPRDSGNVGVYNPSGQYRLRLFINGCWRMVEIDDLLPCFPLPVTLESDWNTRVIMSASSTIKGELWVPLLEKGYLRALGNGYDSKSINPFDVFFSFCQWIPQTSWNLKGIFEKDYEWKKLVRRVKSDNILVILGIQQIDMNDQGPQRFNFITTHSYTLIDVAQIGNSKLFRLRDAHRKEQVSRKFNSTTLLQQYEKRNDGSFWIDIEDAKKYFSMGFLSWRPDLFTYKQQINFVWKEQQYMHDTIDELSQFAPQFLLYKRSKEQKIWILLHRHYQSKVSPYSLIESEQKEEDMLISISFCRHNHPEERPVNPKITHRDGNICFSSTYSKSHFNLFQIGLFDEDIHKTDQNELGLNEVQLHLAKMQEFTCNYVGWFTIRAEILKAPEHSKGDLRFSLYIFSDQKVDQPVPIY